MTPQIDHRRTIVRHPDCVMANVNCTAVRDDVVLKSLGARGSDLGCTEGLKRVFLSKRLAHYQACQAEIGTDARATSTSNRKGDGVQPVAVGGEGGLSQKIQEQPATRKRAVSDWRDSQHD